MRPITGAKKLPCQSADLLKVVSSAAMIKVISMLGVFASGVALARFLDPSGYGTYTWIVAFISLLGIPGRLGLPLLLTRNIAQYQAQGEWEYIKGLLRYSNILVVILSALIILVVSISIKMMDANVEIRDSTILWLGLAILPIMSLSYIRCATLKGLHEIIAAEVPELLVRPFAMLVLIVVMVFFLGGQLNPGTAVFLQLVAVFFSFMVGFYFLRLKFRQYLGAVHPKYDIYQWNKATLSLGLFSGLKISDVHLLPFVIGLIGASSDIGYFRVVITVAALVAFSVNVMEMVLSPYISRLYHQGDIENIKRIFIFSFKVVLVSSVPIFIAIVFYGEYFVVLVFGEAYSIIHEAIVVMCIAHLLSGMTGPAAIVLNMTGHEGHATKNLLLTLAMKLVLCIALVPQFGFLGAVIAECLGLFVNKILMLLKVYQLYMRQYSA